MKCRLLAAVVFNVTALHASAQSDTTYSYSLNGVNRNFTFVKSENRSQLQKLSPRTFPVYSIDRKEYNTMRLLIGGFVELSQNYAQLRVQSSKKDSLMLVKERELQDVSEHERARAENFRKSYEDMTRMGQNLNEQLKNCEQLAKSQRRKRNLRSAFIGGLIALPVGIVIGVVAD